GNTALHYAGQNTSIVAKLLSHRANTKARNKDDLTPLVLAETMVQEPQGVASSRAHSHPWWSIEHQPEARPSRGAGKGPDNTSNLLPL
ncbi:hypothetical protein MC885_011279, partial [Smutsia gigantea]